MAKKQSASKRYSTKRSEAKQKNRKSIILVSHRESTMAIADRIYHVEGGRMYEQTEN